MNGYSFVLSGTALVALPSGALWGPEAGLLVVSDLHFGKSERLARRGGALLPPYETRATLARLDGDLEALGARRVICLGDSFDDLASEAGMEEPDRLWLLRLMAGRDWTWVEGNHDPGPLTLPGTHRAEVALGGLVFRHICTGAVGEVSGHYHPKARLPGRVAPCFLIDRERVILPAYGTYTGGMWCDHPDLTGLMAPDALAVLTGKTCLARPMRA